MLILLWWRLCILWHTCWFYFVGDYLLCDMLYMKHLKRIEGLRILVTTKELYYNVCSSRSWSTVATILLRRWSTEATIIIRRLVNRGDHTHTSIGQLWRPYSYADWSTVATKPLRHWSTVATKLSTLSSTVTSAMGFRRRWWLSECFLQRHNFVYITICGLEEETSILLNFK